jgi:hypothetical protein
MPPEVIISQGIVAVGLIVFSADFRQTCLISAAAKQTVGSHDPSQQVSMLPECLNSILRT